MPYDPNNQNPVDTITARHYDEKSKTWTTLPAEFDTEAKTVTFWVDHFSADGLFGVNNTCTRAQIITFLYKAYN